MLIWQNSEDNLHNDLELQNAFKKLRDKSYAWAMFTIMTELLYLRAAIHREVDNHVDVNKLLYLHPS